MRKASIVLTIILIVTLLAGCGTYPEPNSAVLEFTSSGVDSDSWAFVPAGEYIKGQFDGVGFVENDYEIMVTEVTNTQYAKYLGEALAAGTIEIDDENQVLSFYPGDVNTGYRHEKDIVAQDYILTYLDNAASRIIYDGKNFTVKEGYENHPVAWVTWFGAWSYADFYGYRLPSEDEWEKAARGDDNRAYPWGEEVGHGYLNYYHSGDPFEGSDGYSDTTPVGFYNGNTYGDFHTENAVSPYGLYDMAGNVGEWIAKADTDRYHYRRIRGGNKGTYEIDARIWKEDNADPRFIGPNTGFRVVRDVQ
ncbi:MAG: formylglycine-generating enzyme family protein [Vulcanibacillus sp.]